MMGNGSNDWKRLAGRLWFRVKAYGAFGAKAEIYLSFMKYLVYV